MNALSAFVAGSTESIKQELNEMTRLQNLLVAEITEKSVIKEENLRDYITRKAEWYIPPSEAINLKFATGYYK